MSSTLDSVIILNFTWLTFGLALIVAIIVLIFLRYGIPQPNEPK